MMASWKIKVETLSFTRYAPPHGSVVSISRDSTATNSVPPAIGAGAAERDG